MYEYKPTYWEEGNVYDVELEAPTFESMTLFAQVEQIMKKNGNIYFLGYLQTVNGKTPCVWEKNKLISYSDPTKNSSTSASDFYITDNDDVVIFRTYENCYYEPLDKTFDNIAATFKNGELLKLYCNEESMTRYNNYYHTWCGRIIKVDNDIYLSIVETPSDVDKNNLIIYKNDVEMFRINTSTLLHMCVKDGVVYTCHSYSNPHEYIISFNENEKVTKAIVGKNNFSLIIKGMIVLPE